MTGASATATRLWLLRHPELVESAASRCYGSLDLSLSEQGVQHAHAVAAALRSEPLAAIYTSPLQRCRQAADILAAGRACTPQAMQALSELHFGEWEGRTYEEIAALYPDLYRRWMEQPTATTFPGGESFTEMWMRVTDAVAILRARHAGQSFAVMTHAGVIRILIAEALAMPPGGIFRIGQHYGAINRICYFGEAPVVEVVNTTAIALQGGVICMPQS
jgi:alpha-ribazole phosphatase